MNISRLFILIFILAALQVTAQIAPDKYYIQFTDKNNSPYSIDHPEDFLTARAIQRRDKQDIPIIENDIPVNPQYLQGVANVGVQLLNATRWLNGVTVFTTDSTRIDEILALPYVENVLMLQNEGTGKKKAFFENEHIHKGVFSNAGFKQSRVTDELDYGEARFQINQINGIPLHNAGYHGEGMVIVALDGGFKGVQENPVFDSLWADNRVLGTKDFVNIGGNVFTESQHGKNVLSTMAANYPGLMIGTAPNASYWLLHTEDVKSENVIEEYNWMSGAEFADSVGADVINSSLSYVDFDLPQWDHTYDDLDGNTAVSTIAADLAASKGILVCNSAGNSGGSSFPWNGAPADADSVMSVGAVGYDNQRAGFSSIGPTVDGRIRPVIMALGSNTVVAIGNDTIGHGSGTSFSSPIITGMSACLWQANPNMKVMDVYNAIKQSGNYAQNPNNYMGWGIPDYELANSILTTVENKTDKNDHLARVSPNPFHETLNLNIKTEQPSSNVKVELLNVAGVVIYSESFYLSALSKEIRLGNKLALLPDGLYLLKVAAGDRVDVLKLIKQ